MSARTPPARKVSARFEIGCTRHLAPDGSVLSDLPAFARDRATLVELYSAMALTRIFDQKAVELQRTGRLGTYPSSLGQEAVSVGVASAMRPEDVLVPSFREHGAQIMRGVRIEEVLLYWGGDERGSDFGNAREDFPVCVPVGTQFAHAAGVALAFRLRGEQRVAVVVGGDGATSRGDFHEALNVAGVWSLPVVFVINNNQWAISVPRSQQSAAATLAQKAVGAGIPGEQVDGCDVIAVRSVVARAIDAARSGNGPALIECITYRLSDHTTADDATRYRDDEEVSRHWQAEPLRRLRAYMASDHAWTKEEEHDLRAGLKDRVEQATEAYLGTPPQDPSSIFAHLQANRPAGIGDQPREPPDA